MTSLFAVLAGLLVLAGCGVTSTQPQSSSPLALEVGQPFPELVLPSLDGEPSSLARFRGQKVLLHVFASW